MEEEKRFFAWYDSSRNTTFYGPWMCADAETIGKSLYHTLDDLLKM